MYDAQLKTTEAVQMHSYSVKIVLSVTNDLSSNERRSSEN
jgi:hypothetical protein